MLLVINRRNRGSIVAKYQQYLKRIDQHKDEMVAMLIEWVNTNSGFENLSGLHHVYQQLKQAFSILKADHQEISLKPRTIINSSGTLIEKPTGKLLHLKKRRSNPAVRIILGGHMDTVFPEDSPFQKAVKLNQKRLQGPGVADMKGGLLVMLAALDALENSPFAEHVSWELFINPDEEVGSPSSEPFISSRAKANDVGLIFEPSFPDGSIVSSRKGSMNFSLVSKGKAAHAGRDFEKGRNAISALVKLILKVESLNDPHRGLTINLGHIEGGGSTNIVPDLAICKCNARVVNPQDMDYLKDAIDQLVKDENDQHQAALILHHDTERGPKIFDPRHQEFYKEIENVGKELDLAIQFKPSGGVSDGNILATAGCVNVDTLGVIGKGIHTYEEEADLESYVNHAKLTALMMMKLAAKEIILNHDCLAKECD